MELLASLLYFDIFVKILCFVFVLYSRFLSLLWYLQSVGGCQDFPPGGCTVQPFATISTQRDSSTGGVVLATVAENAQLLRDTATAPSILPLPFPTTKAQIWALWIIRGLFFSEFPSKLE